MYLSMGLSGNCCSDNNEEVAKSPRSEIELIDEDYLTTVLILLLNLSFMNSLTLNGFVGMVY